MSKLKTLAYAKSILEDLYVDSDDKLQFNYKGKEGLNVTMGKGSVTFEPFSSKSKDFGGSEVITLFNTGSIKGTDREKIVTPILKALKGKSTTAVNKDEFKKWLSQAARVMGKYINKTYSPDAVLSIRSSSALNNQFIKELSQHLDASTIIPDQIYKASLDSITIDKKTIYKRSQELEAALKKAEPEQRKTLEADFKKIADKRYKAVEAILKKAKAQGFIEFKKIHTSLRPLLKGVMKLDTVSKNISGKRILVIDDIMTSRKTMSDSIEVIKQYKPISVVGATLFKA